MQISIENLFTRYYVHSHLIHIDMKSQFYIYKLDMIEKIYYN